MDKKETSRTVLFFRSPQLRSWPAKEKLSGIYRYARARRWLVQVLDPPRSAREVRSQVAAWKPLGVLVDMGIERRFFTATSLNGIPAAFLDLDDRFARDSHRVNHDHDAIAALAAKRLSACGFSSYAFVGYLSKTRWSHLREDAFRRHLGDAAKRFSSFEFPPFGGVEEKRRAAFDRWLGKLPKPCGIMLANDYLAEELYPACRRLGLVIPDDISVVGVDDDERFCDNLEPALSSIRQDFRQAGWLLAGTLEGRLANPSLRSSVRLYHPLGFTPRASLARVTRPQDPLVAKTDALLAESACTAKRLPEILAPLGLSRRTVELRYRAATGHTLLDAIRELRLSRAKALLADPSIPLAAVHTRCGYASAAHFNEFFLRATGRTVSFFRRHPGR